MPFISVDRHTLLQILINLRSNARHALPDSARPDKRISLRVRPSLEGRLPIEGREPRG